VKSLRRIVAACAPLVLAGSVTASAQETPPLVPPIEPDRPDITNGTHIVGAGLLQIEFGGLYTRSGGTQRSFGSPVTARFGVFDWLELRIGSDGLLSQSGDTPVTGIGNTQVGAKLRLWADPGGLPVLSILPTVNLPTADAASGLGSGSADYTVALLTGTDLGRHAHVDVNYGIGAVGGGTDRPHYAQHFASISVSDAISDNWNPYVEAFWYSRQDIDGGSVTAIDGGAIYQIGARYALDGGVQIGLSHDAPAFAAFGGITIVVGNIFRDEGAVGRQRAAPNHGGRPAAKK
jgi:hypothetical protein